MKKSVSWSFLALLMAGFVFAAPQAHAVGDEIQVYINDMNEPGKLAVELHTNYVAKGPDSPSYTGELPSNHVLQVTPELAYGLTRNLEAGMYFPPMALAPGGRVYENGMRFRLKFIADQTAGSHLFWGLNTEFGYSTKRVSETFWNLELRPILGYGTADWLVSFNPVLSTAVSGANHTPEFEPCIKLGYAVAPGYMLGIEDYAGFGPTNQISGPRDRENHLYLALDIVKGDLDINLGIGRGLSNTEEKTIVKMIFAVPL